MPPEHAALNRIATRQSTVVKSMANFFFIQISSLLRKIDLDRSNVLAILAQE
jgi:hypothetical protein